ncbi:MAG: hypothetical protein QGG95_09230, partial [Nitrospinota bacterium]|nr:hypothetical protein [Nitrospinota bacterium]
NSVLLKQSLIATSTASTNYAKSSRSATILTITACHVGRDSRWEALFNHSLFLDNSNVFNELLSRHF